MLEVLAGGGGAREIKGKETGMEGVKLSLCAIVVGMFSPEQKGRLMKLRRQKAKQTKKCHSWKTGHVKESLKKLCLALGTELISAGGDWSAKLLREGFFNLYS